MGNFKEDRKRRDLLISAFYERKQYRDNWVSTIETELAEQRQKPDPEKSVEKMEITLKAWQNLHPVIEQYLDTVEEWEKLHFHELWEIIAKDRDLSNVVYNGILHLRSKIKDRREAAGLPVLNKDMVSLSYGEDARDAQQWALLDELEGILHETFRKDKQTAAPAKEIIDGSSDSEKENSELWKRLSARKKGGKWAIELIREWLKSYPKGHGFTETEIRERFVEMYYDAIAIGETELAKGKDKATFVKIIQERIRKALE